MRAALLEGHPDFVLALPGIFAALGIPLTIAGTVEAVRRVAQKSSLDDIIIVDCSLDRPDDRTRCAEIVRHTNLDVHIIYNPTSCDHAAFRRYIERLARGDVAWVPANVSLLDLVAMLRTRQDQVLRARVLSGVYGQPLTEHQLRV